MKNSWRFLPVVFVFALFASMAAAYAPVIKNLPDIYIGDKEDWWGTVDTNLFRFSDAFNLDEYVEDLDNSPTELRWSFVESTSNNWLKINGILQLDLLTEDPKDPGAKNIRAVSPMVSLWDLKDSPESGGPIWPDPVDPLNELVTFYVSDGLFVDSDTVLVQAVDNDYDRISAVPTPTPSPTPGWESIRLDDFEGNTDGYTFTGPAINSYDNRCTGATSSFDGHRLGVTTDNTTNRFGFWLNTSEIPYEANKLYKMAWKCSTNQATATSVPTIRFRANAKNLSYSYEMVITSQTGAMSPPTSGSRTYNQYVLPLTASGFDIAIDVYDYDLPDQGTVYLEEVEIFKGDIPADGWTALTVPAFTSWTLVNNISPYAAFATTGQTASYLRLGSALATSTGFAFWGSPTTLTWTAGKLYRAVFTLSSPSGSSTILGAVRAASADYDWTSRLRFYGATVPASGGTQYPVYFEAASGTNFFLVYEGMDFESDRGGYNDLTAVVVEEHDLW